MNILSKISQIFSDFGLLRLSLLALCFISIGLSFLADGTTHLHDWRLVPSVLAPSIAMMLVFAIPLDITMAFIFKSDSGELEKPRYEKILS
jgi:hypothetical protein